jgi:hypothetical protein
VDVSEAVLVKQALRLEDGHNLREGILKNAKLAQHIYIVGHWIGCNEAKIFQI